MHLSLSLEVQILTFLEESGQESGEPGLSARVRPLAKYHCSKKKRGGFSLGSGEREMVLRRD